MIPTDSPQPQKRRNASMVQAFSCAINGFYLALRSEPHMRFHVIAAILAVSLGLYFSVSLQEWGMLFIIIGIVLMAELFNTAIETTLDLVMPTPHPTVKAAKDIAAAAVWISAVMSSLIGSLIFIPKFVRLFA
jgi:diacylglycerol kinase